MFADAEYLGTDNPAVDDINGSASSNTFTVKNAEFNNVSRIDGFTTNDSIVAANDVHVGTFVLSHNNVRDVKVNTITATLNSVMGT